ncbi:plasmid mobilization protein [Nitratiruptor tergarcus]|uniref:Ribbon-helix-helix protein, copG family n=1 Tax=Nitratiruptor tergarcus DSM 16512 TaxID=1069081 RepID=A0A1W1WVG4_9BACT|nr:ribbon-helix-helix domain-containing protein [Nitratiruptor tergarcus]SMC10179.1 Ribbon-helix-helix protein, copG family [Nitratiruptor tergarcus DSM 16512]
MNKFANVITREIKTHTAIQKRGGRPKKNESEKRDQKITIALTKDEKRKLEEMAEEEGLSVGVFVRKTLKQQEVI